MLDDQKSLPEILPITSNQFKHLGSKGGLARKNNLTPEQRSEIARKAGSAKGTKGLEKATHQGQLNFGDSRVDCYVLKNGIRVVSIASIGKALGLSNPSAKTIKKASAIKTPFFLSSDALSPYLSKVFEGRPEIITFISKTGNKTEGIDAKILPDICEAYLKARDEGKLPPQQLKTAIAAEIIIRSLARIGIIALVDEATSFQEERARDELQILLKKFINEDLLKWTQRFPHQFFREVYKIHGWKYKEGQCRHPSCLGNFINKYVYDSISPEVKKELELKNPVIEETGRREVRHHQYLTPDIGIPALDRHLIQCIGLLRASRSKEEFNELFKRVFDSESSTPDQYN